MCGIFGYVHRTAIPNLPKIKVSALLNHRGPDDSGWLLYNKTNTVLRGKDNLPDIAANLFLLHKRLSILDLDASAGQPMCCENQRYFLVFNGEIYNYLELKQELLEQGARFLTQSDSEVLLKAYIHWGEACLKKFIGMFSFVVFDRTNSCLFIARDPFGIKPFYYAVHEDSFLFSSEIKALIEFLPQQTANAQSLFHYLRSGLTDFGDATLFADVKQLQAGHFLRIDLQQPAKTVPYCYWRPGITLHNDITFQEAAAHLRHLFLKNIELHMRSDVPVATTLSGGIDSSAITMAVRYLYPNTDLQTFSYIASQDSLSEEPWIDIINATANTASHKVYANSTHLFADLDALIAEQDEPFGSTSIYAQRRVFQAANASGIKVMLDGQGADEMLGGYTFYLSARLASLLKQGRFKQASYLFNQSKPYVGRDVLMQSLAYLLPPAIQSPLRRFTHKKYIPSWVSKDWFNQEDINMSPVIRQYGRNVLHEELLHTLSYSSLPMLLRYVDRNSMTYSIESRLPFLTTEFVEFVFSLPEHYLISERGLSKAVFREAMKGIVPDIILQRRDKIGFATPEKSWLMTLKPWIEKILYSDHAKQLSVFNHHQLVLDWQKMLSAKTQFDARFWRWINYIKWSEIHQIGVTT